MQTILLNFLLILCKRGYYSLVGVLACSGRMIKADLSKLSISSNEVTFYSWDLKDRLQGMEMMGTNVSHVKISVSGKILLGSLENR